MEASGADAGVGAGAARAVLRSLGGVRASGAVGAVEGDGLAASVW